ncbi:MAG: GNAT family N-acetyltransferase [Bacilli bacterium]|nr:GNAT family N-acetyltransferase [Bacilli bacterium]
MNKKILKEQDIPDLNIFMMCDRLNTKALSKLSEEFYIRTCREDELKLWKEFPFDNAQDKKDNINYMTNYFNDVYSNKIDEFYKRCLFVCEKKTDKPIATCFIWKSYNKINTIHWFKTLKEYEGKGIGRALLSYIMLSLDQEDYPVFLHTQPSSFRAIGLYSDFGFKIVTNKTIGYRDNNYKESLPILKQFMQTDKYNNLKFIEAPSLFNESAKTSKINQF